MAYAIFAVAADLIMSVYHETAAVSLSLGSEFDGDWDIKWEIYCHPW